MKKYTSYVLSTLLAASFIGCGSDSVDETIKDAVGSLEKRTVVVERGAVYDANVTDAAGNVATQQDGNNTYVFDVEPVYPVNAEGGWIDVDGDGNMTIGVDAILDINLTSYINIVTPTTTYLADENETIRIDRLAQLANETNTSTEDLLKVPSESTKHSIYVLNAVYEKLMDKKNEHSKAHIAIGDILDRYYSYKSNDNTDENATSGEIALTVEKQAMEKLSVKGYIKKLDSDDVAKFQKQQKEKKEKKEKKGGFESDDNNSTLDSDGNDDSKGKGKYKDSDENNTTSDDDFKGNKKPEKSDNDDDSKGKPEKSDDDDSTGKPEKSDDDDSTGKPEKSDDDDSSKGAPEKSDSDGDSKAKGKPTK